MAEITTKRELITPEKALEYKKLNFDKNRKISIPHVYNLKLAMLNKEWVSDGSDIKFDIEGRLIDGQHRLEAIIRAGIPVEMLVTRGLSHEAAQVMDRGKTRSVSDVLKLTSNNNILQVDVSVLSGMLLPISYKKNGFNKILSNLTQVKLDASNLSHEQKIKLTTQFLECIRFGRKFDNYDNGINKIAISGVLARAYHCKFTDKNKLNKFMELLHGQTRITTYQYEGTVLSCREKLLIDSQFKEGLIGRLKTFALVQYVLELYLKGESRKHLHIPDDLTKITYTVPELDDLFL